MGKRSNKTLRSLEDLGEEFDVGSVQKNLLNDLLKNEYINKTQNTEKVEKIIENNNEEVENIVKEEIKINEAIENKEVNNSGNITLEQLKEELDFTQKRAFGGSKNYFDKRIDFAIQKIDNVEKKLDLLLEVHKVDVDKAKEQQAIKDMISKLSNMLGRE